MASNKQWSDKLVQPIYTLPTQTKPHHCPGHAYQLPLDTTMLIVDNLSVTKHWPGVHKGHTMPVVDNLSVTERRPEKCMFFAAHYVSVHNCHVMLAYIVCKTKIKCLCYRLWHIYPTNKLCTLVPRLSPRMNKNFSVLQVTESWAGLGNDAINSVASTIVHLQYPAAQTKSHVPVSLNSRTKTVRKWCRYLQNFWKLPWASLGINYCTEFVLWTPNIA